MPPASLLSLSSSRPWALFSRVAICITHRSHPRARSSRIDPPNRYTNGDTGEPATANLPRDIIILFPCRLVVYLSCSEFSHGTATIDLPREIHDPSRHEKMEITCVVTFVSSAFLVRVQLLGFFREPPCLTICQEWCMSRFASITHHTSFLISVTWHIEWFRLTVSFEILSSSVLFQFICILSLERGRIYREISKMYI